MKDVGFAQTATLYYRQGASDKIYRVAIEPDGDAFVVNFAFGRRGAALQSGTKTPRPVPYEQAREVFDRLVREKVAKGYTPAGPDVAPFHGTALAGRATGVVPQLLTAVDDADIEGLLGDEKWWVQEKLDGTRLLIDKDGPTVTGINRRGLTVGLPADIVSAVADLDVDSFLLDGECVGDTYHAFDLLEVRGTDLRAMPYAARYGELMNVVDACSSDHIRYVPAATREAAKRRTLDDLRRAGREGVVFKDRNAPYTPCRPARGGSQLKLKFVATASCIVAGRSGRRRRSVRLALLDGHGNRVDVGHVTVPAGCPIPEPGSVAEVRYLYAFPDGGCLYQPVLLGIRDDVGPEQCVVSQLKFKPAMGPDADDEAHDAGSVGGAPPGTPGSDVVTRVAAD